MILQSNSNKMCKNSKSNCARLRMVNNIEMEPVGKELKVGGGKNRTGRD
jgi:hypothetical protein